MPPSAIAPAPKAKLTEAVTEAVEESAGTLVKRAPVWAIGLALLMIVGIGGVWLLRDMIITLSVNQERLQKLETEVAHCKENRTRLEGEITDLRTENLQLRARVTRLETTLPQP